MTWLGFVYLLVVWILFAFAAAAAYALLKWLHTQ